MCKVIVLIPCYNEEKNIESVVQNIESVISSNNSMPGKYTIDYLIINDCSKDATIDICRKKKYNFLDLPVNLGIGGAIQAGYLYALEGGYDIAIQHDGDGQHDPYYFDDVIFPIISGRADIVIGSRFLDKTGFQSTGLRRFGIAFLSNLIHFCTGVKVHDVTSGYRAVNHTYIRIFANYYAQDYPEPEAIMNAVLNKAKIKEIPVIMSERKEGKSSINVIKSFYYMIKVSLSILLYRIIVSTKN